MAKKPAPTPEMGAKIIQLILRGKVDGHLDRITNAILERRKILNQLKLATMTTGMRVEFNARVKPKYLKGQQGEISAIEGEQVVILMDRQVRRYGGIIKAPVGIIDVIEEAP